MYLLVFGFHLIYVGPPITCFFAARFARKNQRQTLADRSSFVLL